MRVLVTGGCGCIGSELSQVLVNRGDQVIVLDNLSSGKLEHIAPMLKAENFRLIEGDLLDFDLLLSSCYGIDMVWHLAGNSDTKFALEDRTDRDLNQNVLGTYYVLESMRRQGVGRLAFASTSAVYGNSERQPIPESQACFPISLHGASKAACEALIGSFQHLFGMRCAVFRLANIVGSKARERGRTVISDLLSKLQSDQSSLKILGDGNQTKSYLHVSECVDAMLFVAEHAPEPLAIYNIGSRDSLSVKRLADLVVAATGLPEIPYTFTGTGGGWPGDVPRFTLDISALRKIGWQPRHSSEESICTALREIAHTSNS